MMGYQRNYQSDFKLTEHITICNKKQDKASVTQFSNFFLKSRNKSHCSHDLVEKEEEGAFDTLCFA